MYIRSIKKKMCETLRKMLEMCLIVILRYNIQPIYNDNTRFIWPATRHITKKKKQSLNL